MSENPSYKELKQRINELETEKALSSLAIRQFNSYMATLHETALGILSELDLGALLKNILQRASRLIGMDDGYIFLYEQENDDLVINYGIGRFENEIGFRLKPGEGLSGKVWQSGKPFKINEYDTWNGRSSHQSWNGMGFDVGIPLKSGDKLIGVIGLCSYNKGKKISENEELILHRFAELASIALYNAELHASFQQELDEKIKTEKALRISQDTLHIILNSIDATIYVSDLKTNEIIFMNKRMKDSFGGNFEGQKCHKVFKGEKYPCGDCTNDKLVDQEGRPTDLIVWEGKHPITKKWYLNFDRAVEWNDGRMVKLQIASDITSLKSLEKERANIEFQLFQSQKMEAIGTLAGGIAHDFNNLLMGIQGRASLVLTDIDPYHPHYEHLKGIEDYVKSAADLTKQLLAFARGGKYEVKPTDLNKLLHKSAEMFRRTKKEIKIHKKFQNDIWTVGVDQSQIEQVLLNLYVNAWQSMPGAGELYLETENIVLAADDVKSYSITPGKYVKIAVTDTGIGMDKATQERIFDPFFTTKERGRGTGLGLASAYGIIKNHSGIINVYSEKERGTTFNIFLPASEKGVKEEKELETDVLKGSETILLVDDEDMVIDVGKQILEKLGYKVLTAKGGEKAINIYKKNAVEIDMVILDMIMPEMGGGETYDKLKKINPNLKVLLSSGYSINGQATEILGQGCNGFIQKPFSLIDLSQKLRDILEND